MASADSREKAPAKPLAMHQVSAGIWSITLVFWAALALVSLYSGSDEVITLPLPLLLMLAATGLGFSLKKRALPLLLVALVSFFPVGLYMLGSETVFRLVGVFNLAAIGLALALLLRERRDKRPESNPE